MLTKTWNPEDGRFDVLFDLPSELDIDHAAVVGEFNSWDPDADRMAKNGDGRWVATVSLEPGTSHRFRYHLGGDRWENDWSADDYVDNEFGGSDSLVVLPEAPAPPPPAKKPAAKKSSSKKPAAKKSAAKATNKAAAPKKKSS